MKWDDIINSPFQRLMKDLDWKNKLMQDLDWKNKLMQDLDWKSKVMQDLDWKSKLYPSSGGLQQLEEQQRIWEVLRPYQTIQSHIDAMNNVRQQWEAVRGISLLSASAVEDYRVSFNKDYNLIPKTINSLLPGRLIGLEDLTERLSGIHRLEDDYKKIIDTCNIDYILPTQRVVSSIAGIAAACSFSAESNFNHISLCNSLSYQSYIEKQLKLIGRDDPNVAIRRAVVTELSGGLYESSETAAGLGLSSFYEDSVPSDEMFSVHSPNLYRVNNQHLAFLYRKAEGGDVDQSFYGSVPAQINQLGCSIVAKICSINELSCRKGSNAIFKYTNKSIMACSIIPTTIATTDSSFAEIIDYLYFLIYEGSGTASRLITVVDKDALLPLWWVKHLRLGFRHDIEHGKEKEIADKFIAIGNAYLSLIGVEKPRSQKDWVQAQLILYQHILLMLDDVHAKQ